MSQDLKNNAIFVYQGGRSEPLDKKTSFGEQAYFVNFKYFFGPSVVAVTSNQTSSYSVTVTVSQNNHQSFSVGVFVPLGIIFFLSLVAVSYDMAGFLYRSSLWSSVEEGGCCPHILLPPVHRY